jgi:hypothetical protein
MRRFLSLRVAPGVRLSASRRGMRAHVGPRLARLHVGGGRSGLSTGAGPVTWYSSGTSASRGRRTPGKGLTAAQAQKLDAHRAAAHQLNALLAAHEQTFAPVEQLRVPDPKLPPFRTLLAAAEKKELQGVGPFDRDARRAARLRARTTAESWAHDLLTRSRKDKAERQAQLDAQWGLLLANDPAVVVPAANARFAASGRTARAVGVDDDCLLVSLTLPSVDAVPSTKPAVTPTGNPTVHQATRTERAEWYRHHLAGQTLLAAKEALAAGPGLRDVRVVATYGGQALVAGDLTRAALERVNWTLYPWDALQAIDPTLLFRFRGQTRELQAIDLSTHPEYAIQSPSPGASDRRTASS